MLIRLLLMCVGLMLAIAPTVAQIDDSALPELEVITAENVERLMQVGMLGYGLIEDMAYAPNGETLAVAVSLGLAFYDATQFEHVPFDHWILPEEMVFAVDYPPDGDILATVSGERHPLNEADYVFRLWDVPTQTILAEWVADYFRTQHIVFSPDGDELVQKRGVIQMLLPQRG